MTGKSKVSTPKTESVQAEKPETKRKTIIQVVGRTIQNNTGRFVLLAIVLAVLGVFYVYAREKWYREIVFSLAQDSLDTLFTADVEKIGRVELDAQGDLHLYDVILLDNERGEKRQCFRCSEVVIAFDDQPLSSEGVRIQRVDLIYPSLRVLRYPDGHWNSLTIFIPRVVPEEKEEEDDTGIPVHRGSFPPNGVHVYNGIIDIAFRDKEGDEVTWTIENVDGKMFVDEKDVLRFEPFRGTFYGGQVEAHASIPSSDPFIFDCLVTIRNADVGKLTAGSDWLEKPITGKLDAVISIGRNTERGGEFNAAAGTVKLSEGDLWEFPALIGVINVFSLDWFSDRKVTGATMRFNMAHNRVEIKQLDLEGSPMNLYGYGWVNMTGKKLKLTFFPRVNSGFRNIPIVGSPIQDLLDLLAGNIIPVVIEGSWDKVEGKVDRTQEIPEELKTKEK